MTAMTRRVPRHRQQREQRVLCCSLRRYNVLMLSFALMLLFTAFNTLQSWLTNLFSTLGNQLLTVLYISVCIALFVTPPLVHFLSHRRSILVGAACYVVFIASLIRVETASTIIASVINGFGASLLWVAVGGFLTRCSEEHDRGTNTGIFWCIFQLSSIIGNLLAWLVINHLDSTWLLIIFTSIAVAGTSLLLLLRPFPDSPSRKSSWADEEREPSDVAATTVTSPSRAASPSSLLYDPSSTNINSNNRSSLSRIISNNNSNTTDADAELTVVTADNTAADNATDTDFLPLSEQGVLDVPHPPLLHTAPKPTVRSLLRSLGHVVRFSSISLMFPAFLFQGIEFSFWNGEYPNFYDQSVLGLVLLWAGVGEAAGGVITGTMSDRIGRSLTWVFGILVYLLSLDAVYLIKSGASVATDLQFQGVPLLACAAALCFGLADSAFNTQIYALLGSKFKKVHEEHDGHEHGHENKPPHDDRYVVAAFTCFNFFQNIGAAVGFFYQPSFPVHGADGTYMQVCVGLVLAVLSTVGFVACDRNWFPSMDTLDEVEGSLQAQEQQVQVQREQQKRRAALPSRTDDAMADGFTSLDQYAGASSRVHVSKM